MKYAAKYLKYKLARFFLDLYFCLSVTNLFKTVKPPWYLSKGILGRNMVNKWRNKHLRRLPAGQNNWIDMV